MHKVLYIIILIGINLTLLISCNNEQNKSAFKLLTADQTGLDFENTLTQSTEFSVFDYMYFYNGGGLAAADFNNDGLVDLYFTANMGKNKLFLNRGDLKFEDVTDQAALGTSSDWSTGASVVDINNDGLLDIYVSQVGDHKILKATNQLFICKGIKEGIPFYADEAIKYDLDLVGFSTQATFIDFDRDGDLDMFQLNHSVHENGTYGKREEFENKTNEVAGDRLFRNDDGKFIDITKAAGIQSSALGYGLGIATGDLNNDGYVDIYIGNDFHENDYLYLNQQNGTFKEVLTEQINHTGRFSMGVDVADFNNDGFSDIISLDMLPYDPVILKSSLGEDPYDVYKFKKRFGYNDQFARNNLQLNNGNGTFSEIGLLAGIYASDWSWASVFADFNNDGKKDLFISNGIPRRMNDIDYTNYMAENKDQRMKTQMGYTDSADLEIIDKMPRIKIPNKFFLNSGTLQFTDMAEAIENNLPTYSNGSVLVDLDNDGDLDVVVNNIEDKPFIYENLLIQKGEAANDTANSITLHLKGSPANRNAIGSRLLVFTNSGIISNEFYAVKGFQSSMLSNFHTGVGNAQQIDSVILIWPDGGVQPLKSPAFNTIDTISWKANLPKYDYSKLFASTNAEFVVTEIADSFGLTFTHAENDFVEFNRERLMPHMVSAEGPALAVGDINNDGLEDVFIGGAKRIKNTIFMQRSNGQFERVSSTLLANDSIFEDVDASLVDLDNDGYLDLLVASGGNEYSGESEYLSQRIYWNNGAGEFTEKLYLEGVSITASRVLASDFNGDALPDVFVGARAVPKNYGVSPKSHLLINKGNRKFVNVTDEKLPNKGLLGMVVDAVSADVSGDEANDIIIAVEWENIQLLENDNGNFSLKNVGDNAGLWKALSLQDVDGDGDLDVIAGNNGLNSKLKASQTQPINMYINDFDDNGSKEQIITYYLSNQEVAFATHAELMKQMPALRKKYQMATDFANAEFEELFDKGKLAKAKKLTVNNLANCWFEQTEKGVFTKHQLPTKLQFSTLHAVAPLNDAKTFITGGNFFENNIEMGKYDADYGNIVSFTDNGQVSVKRTKGLNLSGQVKSIKPIKIKGSTYYLVAINNEPLKLLSIEKVN